MKKLTSQPGLVLVVVLLLLSAGCLHSSASTKKTTALAEKAALYAKQMVGTRYRYGGNNPAKGFDCSGLVYYSYDKAGAEVPRSTKLQRRASKAVSLKYIRKGDLLFFNQLGKRASHVGIYVGKNKFVHAPSSGKRVRIDELNNPYWQKHLEYVRRFYNI